MVATKRHWPPLKQHRLFAASEVEHFIKPIPGLEPNYFAGQDGHIYSKKYNQFRKWVGRYTMMDESVGTGGYLRWSSSDRKRRVTHRVHRSVCMAFHGEQPAEKPVIRHLNGNQLDNRPENLAWGDSYENAADAIRHGTILHGERHHKAKLTAVQAAEIKARVLRGEISRGKAAKEYGVSKSAVQHIVNGKAWRLALLVLAEKGEI